MLKFTINHRESKARVGVISLAHGEVETPTFMPVGTLGTVKAIDQKRLKEEVGAQIILGNAYHLYFRPGLEVLKKAGGLHSFMSWENVILTDSGGYQVYSLSTNRKITPEGVHFKSHIDGSNHFFSPKQVIDIQRIIGADIMMSFDECLSYPCQYQEAQKSLHITHRWEKQCHERYLQTKGLYGYEQALFPIVQGSTYEDLRKQSADFTASLDLPGIAIGGLSVGEPAEIMYQITELVCDILPWNKPRYLMGVGTPANILENIALGVDMFDCVMPTRNARNGMLFTTEGIINIKNEKWKTEFSCLDKGLDNSFSNSYSRAYLRHLFASGEMLGPQIATLHNLSFYHWLVKMAKKKIQTGNYHSWKSKMIKHLMKRL